MVSSSDSDVSTSHATAELGVVAVYGAIMRVKNNTRP